MNKAKTIAYAITKECQLYNFAEWCEEWGFTVDDFYRFLELGQEAFENDS